MRPLPHVEDVASCHRQLNHPPSALPTSASHRQSHRPPRTPPPDLGMLDLAYRASDSDSPAVAKGGCGEEEEDPRRRPAPLLDISVVSRDRASGWFFELLKLSPVFFFFFSAAQADSLSFSNSNSLALFRGEKKWTCPKARSSCQISTLTARRKEAASV